MTSQADGRLGLAALLLDRLGPGNDALLGDLAEERRAGRSALWYWRQVLTAIVIRSSDSIHAHRGRSLKALAISVFVSYVISVPTAELGNAVNWVLTPLVPTWFLDYELYTLWLALIWFGAHFCMGWLVAGLNWDHEAPSLLILVGVILAFEIPGTVTSGLRAFQDHQVLMFLFTNLSILPICLTAAVAGGVTFIARQS
jgi:hypothetical protein